MRTILFIAVLVLVSSCFAVEIDIVDYIAYSTNETAEVAYGNYVYIRVYHGLEIWDYSDPVNPEYLYSIDLQDVLSDAIISELVIPDRCLY